MLVVTIVKDGVVIQLMGLEKPQIVGLEGIFSGEPRERFGAFVVSIFPKHMPY